ncbi:hypothetical protein FKM82_021702 [Ascaphus truei]
MAGGSSIFSAAPNMLRCGTGALNNKWEILGDPKIDLWFWTWHFLVSLLLHKTSVTCLDASVHSVRGKKTTRLYFVSPISARTPR